MKNEQILYQEDSIMINHVLVIDDDQLTDVLLDGISSNLDLINRYVFKTNGWKALEYLYFCRQTNDFPDLIILDLRMPEMSGFEFLEEYEKLFYLDFPNTKVVIATNSTTASEKETAAGFPSIDLFINKPFLKEKFVHIYKTLFNPAA